MNLEKDDSYTNLLTMHDRCKKFMNYHVKFTMKDGSTFDGVIVNMEPDKIIALVGKDVIDKGDDDIKYNHKNQYRLVYGVPQPYPIRYRYFGPQEFPVASLAALSLLSYPYFTPPYPYNYYNPFYPVY